MSDPSPEARAEQIDKRIKEARQVLQALGLPPAQQKEQSALTFLALLKLRADQSWSEATAPLMGITPMMGFMEKEYDRKYAPNTRETVRRQSVHQFLDAGLIVANPDNPKRATNSGNNVYQVEASVLTLLRTFETPQWEANLAIYLASVQTLKERYAQEREMHRIPIQLAPGIAITLSPGGQNVLVKQIMDEFVPRFAPGGIPIYVGDTDTKDAYYDREGLAALGVSINDHGKIPDVIIHHTAKNWLLLIEAVTSHGPINAKRREDLKTLFQGSTAGLVFVTTFLNRRAMIKYLPEISWETEVWVADAPSHMIHFNGERFLGPYEM